MNAASYSSNHAVLFKLQILSGFSDGPELLTGGTSGNIGLLAVRNWPGHRGVPVLAFCPFQESDLECWEIWTGCRKKEKGGETHEIWWQMEVGRVVKQKNLTPDDSVKG